MLKYFFVKDFDHFSDRRNFKLSSGHERETMVTQMLSYKNGAEWKTLRAIMSPTFTSGKIKSMFPLVCDKADALVKFSMKEAAENPHVDMKKKFGRYTLDAIASCAFGIECNSLVDENAEFSRMVEAYFQKTPKRIFKTLLHKFIPTLFKLFRISIYPPATDYFISAVKQTIAARKAGNKRGDFLDLLLEAQGSPDDLNGKHVLSDLGIVAQCVMFLIAGNDTTTSLLSFSSFLLAKNKDQQHRLRDELRQMVAEHGDITYQAIMEAKLLDACLQGNKFSNLIN
ncbi:Cytochrome P450 3A41 [Chionoecetes opilio]|uniref:Cytochrome P450 3A41 n=1 Tax=Chionoecetes opilio TaxID=41210 RepID=A0A8J4XPA6_CHIOP|nr:Cytochrome P450 3A41 [Chionoecetes opilio]